MRSGHWHGCSMGLHLEGALQEFVRALTLVGDPCSGVQVEGDPWRRERPALADEEALPRRTQRRNL